MDSKNSSWNTKLKQVFEGLLGSLNSYVLLILAVILSAALGCKCDNLSLDCWAPFILCLSFGFLTALRVSINSSLPLFESHLIFRIMKFIVVQLPCLAGVWAATMNKGSLWPLNFKLSPQKNPPWFKLTENLLKWVFTSAFPLTVCDNNTIHSLKQCLCLGLLKLSHCFRKRALPWATRQRGVMTNYNLIVPIKDNLPCKQGLKQSPRAFPGKERWDHQMPLCMAAMLCGLPSCWQLQENPHRHAEQTSTELHKI